MAVAHSSSDKNTVSTVSFVFGYRDRDITLADSPLYAFSSVEEVHVKTGFVGEEDVGPLVPPPTAAMTTPSQSLSLVMGSHFVPHAGLMGSNANGAWVDSYACSSSKGSGDFNRT